MAKNVFCEVTVTFDHQILLIHPRVQVDMNFKILLLVDLSKHHSCVPDLLRTLIPFCSQWAVVPTFLQFGKDIYNQPLMFIKVPQTFVNQSNRVEIDQS